MNDMCVRFVNVQTGKEEDKSLIDKRLCDAINQECEDDGFLMDWFNSVALATLEGGSMCDIVSLALKNWSDDTKNYIKKSWYKIIKWIDSNYKIELFDPDPCEMNCHA